MYSHRSVAQLASLIIKLEIIVTHSYVTYVTMNIRFTKNHNNLFLNRLSECIIIQRDIFNKSVIHNSVNILFFLSINNYHREVIALQTVYTRIIVMTLHSLQIYVATFFKF